MIPERSHFQNRGGNLFRFLNCGAGTGENESRISFSISFCLQKSRRSRSQNYRVEKTLHGSAAQGAPGLLAVLEAFEGLPPRGLFLAKALRGSFSLLRDEDG